MMEIALTDNPLEERPIWHRPQVQHLIVATATSVYQVAKNGSTEDFFSHAPDWPSGVPIT